MEPIISFDHFGFQYTAQAEPTLYDISLDIRKGEKVLICGPSGCGKSTLAHCVNGLIPNSYPGKTTGTLTVGGQNAENLSLFDLSKVVGTVLQDSDGQFIGLTVAEDMAFALENDCMDQKDMKALVDRVAQLVGVSGVLGHAPYEISGGQKQRVALGGVMVSGVDVLLFDEPLSNLDAKLRNQMRAEIIKLREKIDTTFVYVTHDQVEAMTLGDRIVIMRDGFIQQIGTPQEVFNHPANLFVAGFIGTPQMNLFDATLAKKNDKYVATILGHDFELPEAKQAALKAMDKVPSDVIVGVRPVHVHLADNGIDATVDVSELMGSELHLHVNSAGKDVVIVVPTTDIDIDSVHGGHKAVKYSFRPDLMHFFDKKTEKNLF